MEPDVGEALSKIPLFDDVTAEQIETQRLGGLTNRNFRIDSPVGRYVLRLAGEGTSEYIDRSAERYNAQIASDAGVNADLLYFDEDDGTMLCRYVEQSITMDIGTFRDLDAVKRAGLAFRKLHDCGGKFRGRFELFEQIDQYLSVVKKLGASVPEGYEDVHREAESVRRALSKHSLPSAPCHCDPMVENCLDTGKKMYIIDFEYAGNNDPMWDLGDLSVEGDFSVEQDDAFLFSYFGTEPAGFDVGRMVMYKAMCDLLWTLWGVVQHANKNPADDFWAYAVARLNRCKLLMATTDFPRHLRAVERGPREAA